MAGILPFRLECFPYAGGGSAVFHRWRPLVPANIEIRPVGLPGRENRSTEPLEIDLRQAAKSLASELAPPTDRPWGMLGHSMGAWLAFEVARELRRRQGPQPALLVVAASNAPDARRVAPAEATSPPGEQAATPASNAPLHTLSDERFVDAVQSRFGGIPPSVRENAELLKMLLPILRADIEMVETYRYIDEAPLDIEILALGGTDDRAVSPAGIGAWRHHTTAKFSSRLLPGGHFFLFPSIASPGATPHRRVESTRPRTGRRSPVALAPALQIILSKIEQIQRAST